MFELLILVTSLTGQICYEPIIYYEYTCPTVVGPPIYIEYSLHGMTERSKFWAMTPYLDGRYRRVPIVNGYAPRVYFKRRSDGSDCFLYDYQDRIVYEDIILADKRKRIPIEIPLLPGPAPSHPSILRTLPLAPLRPTAPRVPKLLEGLRDPSSISEPRVRISPNYRLGQ